MLTVPQSSAVLLAFALFEDAEPYEQHAGSLVLCATEDEISTFLRKLPNAAGSGCVDSELLAPYKYLSEVCQSDRRSVESMLREANSAASAIKADTSNATSQVSPSFMPPPPFTGALERRLPQRAGDRYCATDVSTAKDKWEYEQAEG